MSHRTDTQIVREGLDYVQEQLGHVADYGEDLIERHELTATKHRRLMMRSDEIVSHALDELQVVLDEANLRSWWAA